MKVYIVTSGEYSDYMINQVFLDREKAELYCAAQETDWDKPRIEEYDTFDTEITGDSHNVKTCCKAWFRGGGLEDYYKVFYSFEAKNRVSPITSRYKERYVVEFSCKGDLTRERIEKIGQDMIAKYKAEQEGL